MKALVAQALTGTSGLAYVDVPDLVSSDAVIVDVGAAGVCFPDLLLLRGEYQLRLEPPFTPGMEVAGTVRSAPEGSGFTPGQRVSAMTMLGGYAEQVAVAPPNVIPTADGLDDAIRVLAPEGRLLVIGFAAGGGIPTVKVNRLLLRNVSVVGRVPAPQPSRSGSGRSRTGQAGRGGAPAACPGAVPAVRGRVRTRRARQRWGAGEARARAVMSACAKNIGP